MKNLLKGMLLGGFSLYLAGVIYNQGYYEGCKDGKQIGELIGQCK